MFLLLERDSRKGNYGDGKLGGVLVVALMRGLRIYCILRQNLLNRSLQFCQLLNLPLSTSSQAKYQDIGSLSTMRPAVSTLSWKGRSFTFRKL